MTEKIAFEKPSLITRKFFKTDKIISIENVLCNSTKKWFYRKNLFHLLESILKMMFLTLEQKQFYKENGFIKLDNIFNFEEINQISEDYDDLFQVVPICILADRANIINYLIWKTNWVALQRKDAENANVRAIWKGDWQQKMNAQGATHHVKSIHNLQVCRFQISW